MGQIPEAEYQGGRRGGHAESIARRPNLMPSYTVGQALAALHGDPAVAYNKKSEIWALDSLYAKYFNEDTTARHIVFAFSLIRAIEARKLSLIVLDAGMKADALKRAIDTFSSLTEATMSFNEAIYGAFGAKVIVS